MTTRLIGDRGALLSPDGRYRYRLWRRIGEGERRVLFVMLNPSTADASDDDPTIRRCIGFSQREGGAILDVVNLFAWRATKPGNLRFAKGDPVGRDNDATITAAAREADVVILAYGALSPERQRRASAVLTLLRGQACELWCLGRTQQGYPRHPLYVPRDQPLVEF